MKKIITICNILIIIVSCYFGFFALQGGKIYEILIKLLIIPALFIPDILKLFKINISTGSRLVYLIFIFISYFLGSIINLYNKVSWYDTLAHTTFGFFASFFILEFLIQNKQKNLFFNIIIIISVVALFAGMWEAFEFTTDKIFGKDAQRVLLTGVNDTMKDMIVAYIGSLVFIFMYSFEKLYNKNLLINKFIKNIKNYQK